MTNVTGLLRSLWLDPGGPRCQVLPRSTHSTESSISLVTSSPVVNLSEIFTRDGAVQLGVSLVRVLRKSNEALHHHSSHIVGFVTVGTGYLRMPGSQNKEQQIDISVGDVVLIPRGAPHMFECQGNSGLEYVAVEFSDREIDYQKHYPVSIP